MDLHCYTFALASVGHRSEENAGIRDTGSTIAHKLGPRKLPDLTRSSSFLRMHGEWTAFVIHYSTCVCRLV